MNIDPNYQFADASVDDRISTTAQGNAFRDRVRDLIALHPSCGNVQTECRIGSQTVDVYYEEQTSVRTRRIACECKDHDRPLTKSIIEREVYLKYKPLLDANLIDDVRIIAPLDVGSEAQQYVKVCGFSFTTSDRLEAEMIDFRGYMRSLSALYAEGGLDQYYIEPALEGGGDLEALITGWIDTDSDVAQPIAILAGYGMGKTSFARRLAHRLAQRRLGSESPRIPVLIPLSEIASEQTLEGLLGKLLTAQNRVPGYHFGIFEELNRRGRFVIILDGFDEMKHTMSWSEFKFNFAQLNRLVQARSRVLLLGRPSAFLSDSELHFVLRGTERKGERQYLVPDAPNYQQLTLPEFSLDQALTFIRRYATYQAVKLAAIRGPEYQVPAIEPRLENIREDPELGALVLRPVQAKMLADLAIDPNVEWRSFSRYELFEQFVSRITEREASKPARGAFDQATRTKFVEEVAWWLWRKGGTSGFDIAQLPRAMLARFSMVEAAESDGLKRDLISGSLLERKAGDRFFFPHRSFIEFLVARHICTEGWTAKTLEDVSLALNAEIVDFVRESACAASIAEWAAIANSVEAQVSARFLALIAWAQNAIAVSAQRAALPGASPRDLLIGYFRFTDAKKPMHEAANYLLHSFRSVTDVQTRLTCILALLVAEQAAEGDLRDALRQRIVAILIRECIPEFQRLAASGGKQGVAADVRNPFMFLLVRAFRSAPLGNQQHLLIGVDAKALHEGVQEQLLLKWRLPDIAESLATSFERVSFSSLAQWERSLALSEDGAIVPAFFNRFPNPATLIPVSARPVSR